MTPNWLIITAVLNAQSMLIDDDENVEMFLEVRPMFLATGWH
jgi:hypothetical protein